MIAFLSRIMDAEIYLGLVYFPLRHALVHLYVWVEVECCFTFTTYGDMVHADLFVLWELSHWSKNSFQGRRLQSRLWPWYYLWPLCLGPIFHHFFALCFTLLFVHIILSAPQETFCRICCLVIVTFMEIGLNFKRTKHLSLVTRFQLMNSSEKVD